MFVCVLVCERLGAMSESLVYIARTYTTSLAELEILEGSEFSGKKIHLYIVQVFTESTDSNGRRMSEE